MLMFKEMVHFTCFLKFERLEGFGKVITDQDSCLFFFSRAPAYFSMFQLEVRAVITSIYFGAVNSLSILNRPYFTHRSVI